MMLEFIDNHRDKHGIEPICSILPLGPVDLPRTESQTGQSNSVACAMGLRCLVS